jgi:hypothetical protein
MGPRQILILRLGLLAILTPVNWWYAYQVWHAILIGAWLPELGRIAALLIALLSLAVAGICLWISTYIPDEVRDRWLLVWPTIVPWSLAGVGVLLLPIPYSAQTIVILWALVGIWAYFRFWPFLDVPPPDPNLHKAAFASKKEAASLNTASLPPVALLMAMEGSSRFLSVQPTKKRRELGNLLIVGPTRSGKGLLATSQLLSWPHSVVVNDIKGELFEQTAGFRSQLGPVYVLDPTGVGHRYDPISSRSSEDDLHSAALQLLYDPDEREQIFTQRAAKMLSALFVAAQEEHFPALPYVGTMVRVGLQQAALRLQARDPNLVITLLGSPLSQTDFENRFLLSSWETLSARLWPLLTEVRLRTFTGSDFAPAELMLSPRPVSIYLRWTERDLLALAPLVRLLVDSLIGELVTTYDSRQGQGCQPVLMLIDEAGRTAIPSLSDHATTVVGRGISLWVAVQSLGQLEAIYGRSRSHVLRDNMESQLYYRPTDLSTAQYLESRLGRASAFARSSTIKDGEVTAEGLIEQPIPLLTSQEIMQLPDETILAFHRSLKPLKVDRVDWRIHGELKKRIDLSPPILTSLEQLVSSLAIVSASQTSGRSGRALRYVDPDEIESGVV